MNNFKFSILNFKTKEAGFTIVEVLISSLVFSIIAISVSSIFIQVIGLERRGFAVQKIQNNALFALEMMSRDIRVSRIADQESPDCSLATLSMTHPSKGSIVYRVSDGTIEKSENGGAYAAISTSDVNFTRMNFCVIGSGISDLQTPRVTILTSVKNRTGKEILQINLQTTVSSRDMSDEFTIIPPTCSATVSGAVTTSTDGSYTVHKFTGSGTFTSSESCNIEVLVVAGGGAGGGSQAQHTYGGGGGAGGLVYNSAFAVTAQAYTVTVGNGGVGVLNAIGGNGEDSVFSSITATGGGGGAAFANGVSGRNGGSGGGGSTGNGSHGFGNGIVGQGNNGGTGTVVYVNDTSTGGGGGGGAGGVGGDKVGIGVGGAGGAGISNSISGASVGYAGGGGGAGGIGFGSASSGGGAGSLGNGNGATATPNTGGGGGGAASGAGGFRTGGNGGSGIVIIRYLSSNSPSPDAFTVLLMHQDGADGSTTFTDSSPSAHVFSSGPTAQISTSQSKFGGASDYFDNTANAYIQTPNSADFNFGTGDFTVDFWYRFSNWTGNDQDYDTILSTYACQAPWYMGWYVTFGYENKVAITAYPSNAGPGNGLEAIWVPTLNQWYHFAFVKSSGTVKMYIGGSEVASAPWNVNISSPCPLRIGSFAAGGAASHGYLDELRISKDIARWTSNFTPPIAPY